MNPNSREVSCKEFVKSVAQGWNRFWFQPADPTVLGMVRIFVGLISLYLHWASTDDLLEFIGPDGWANAQAHQEFRQQQPATDRPSDWSEFNRNFNNPNLENSSRSSRLTEDERNYMLRWDGQDPRKTDAQGFYGWSLWYHVTDKPSIYLVHRCVLVLFFLLTIGCCTRFISVLAWLAALSYMQRQNVAFFGLDSIMSFMTLYLMIGPSGAALSVDRLIARYLRARRALSPSAAKLPAQEGATDTAGSAPGVERDAPVPLASANLAIRLIQIHVCIVYFASGTAKLIGPAWWNGTAAWGLMVNPEFSPVHNQLYMDFIYFLCSHRVLWELFTTGAVAFTLAFEISFPYLIWNRWTRWVMIASAVVLHACIAFFMGLTTFSLLMIAAVCSFIPPESAKRFVRWLTLGKTHLKLSYSAARPRQLRAAAMVRSLDFWNQVHFENREATGAETQCEGTNRWVPSDAPLALRAEGGHLLTGWPLVWCLTRALPVLRPAYVLTGGWLGRVESTPSPDG